MWVDRLETKRRVMGMGMESNRGEKKAAMLAIFISKAGGQ